MSLNGTTMRQKSETVVPVALPTPLPAASCSRCCSFDSVKDTYEPVGDGTTDRCFITTSYDATSHFESTIDDIITIYERVTGEPLIASADDAKESSGGAGAGGGAGVSSKK